MDREENRSWAKGRCELYEWATSSKVGISDETATALMALYDLANGRKIDPAIQARWEKVERIKDGKAILTDLEVEGNGVAWVMLAGLYEGLFEEVIV